MGFLDTFTATLGRAQDELLRTAPDRVTVSLDTFQPAGGDTVTRVRALPQVATMGTGLLLPGAARHDDHRVDLIIEVLPDGAAWTPNITEGFATGGLVLAAKAATDLGVTVGDTITVQHPQNQAGAVRTARSTMRVAGIHPNPMRTLAYLDPAAATIFGLIGTTNTLTVTPAAGSDQLQVRRALLDIPHVASAQSARTLTDGMRASLDEFLGIPAPSWR